MKKYMRCPSCLKKTHGNVDQEYLMRLFGSSESELIDSIKEHTIVLVCHQCQYRWPIEIKRCD